MEKQKHKNEEYDDIEYKRWINKINHNFGMENMPKKLSEDEEAEIRQLHAQRGTLMDRYENICHKIEPFYSKIERLLAIEKEIWESLECVNRRICEIQGHLLSEKIDGDYDDEVCEYYYYRICQLCGKKVYEEGINPNDIVNTAKEFTSPKRIKLSLHR